ncbi:MAG: hypothetical protein ACRCY5_07065 [Phocaeicola sp.]
MKKVIFACAFLCSIGSMNIMAQNVKSIKDAAQKKVESAEKMGSAAQKKVESAEKMVKDLGLSEKQAKEFKTVWEERSPSKDGKSVEKPTLAEMEKKQAEADAKVKKILTEEQYAKYKKLEGEKKGTFKKEAEGKLEKATTEGKAIEKRVEKKVEKKLEKAIEKK